MSKDRPTSQEQFTFFEQMFDLTNTEERDTLGGEGRAEAERSDNHAKIQAEARMAAFQAMVGEAAAQLAREWTWKAGGASTVWKGPIKGVWVHIQIREA